MPIIKGINNIAAIYKGAVLQDTVYLGDTVVFGAAEIPLTPYDITGEGYSSFQIDDWLIRQNAAGLSSTVLTITGNGAPTSLSLDARTAMGLRFVYIIT